MKQPNVITVEEPLGVNPPPPIQHTRALHIPILDMRAQHAEIRQEIAAAIAEVVEAQQFILGPHVQALEEELARYCGVRFGVAVASGTDALILALHAAGVGRGDEVIVPAFSFVATADAVSLLGATPVFIDVDPRTLNLDFAALSAAITERTKAVIPVHLYGQPVRMDRLFAALGNRKIAVIEDGAQALGARYCGAPVGSFGLFGCTSFFPSKNLGGYGDGGMIFTDDPDLADRLRGLRSHGGRRKYVHEEQGWNSRLDELQAAVLRVKLPHLDAWNGGRRRNASMYNALLRDIEGVTGLDVDAGCEPVYHQYTVRVVDRDRVQARLAERGIGTAVHYPIPLHLQGMYRHLGYRAGDLPVAEAAAREVLSLPVYPELSEAQVEYVAGQLRAVMMETTVQPQCATGMAAD